MSKKLVLTPIFKLALGIHKKQFIIQYVEQPTGVSLKIIVAHVRSKKRW